VARGSALEHPRHRIQFVALLGLLLFAVEQPLRGVQTAIRVVVSEGLVVRPVVAGLTQLLRIALPDAADLTAEKPPLSSNVTMESCVWLLSLFTLTAITGVELLAPNVPSPA
jgi:hypothetical protein